jgi:Na+/H+ antiporter NhaA
MTAGPAPLLPWRMLQSFLATEAASGFVLVGAAAAALVVANSPLAPAYAALLHVDIAGLSVLHWVNDGLMAIFFLLVGLEIKRELIEGQLSTTARRILPGVAALAGMAVPALIYLETARGDPGALRGWAIPAATDIAFALGVLAVLGKRVPPSLRIFLTAVAIIDDLGAIVVIAVFYTASIDLPALAAAAAGIAVLVACNRARVTALWPYLVVGATVWHFVHASGIHATLAGIAVAMTPSARTPAQPARLVRRCADFRLRQRRDFVRRDSSGRSCCTPAAGNRRWPRDRQAAGHFRHGMDTVPSRAGEPSARSVVAADLRRRPALRNRLHDEPVHRRLGVRRRQS